MTDEPAFDKNDVRSLGNKLAQLELTDGERAAMAALISDDDVSGFARFNFVGEIRLGYQDGTDLFLTGGRHGLQADGIVGPNTFKPGRF